MEAEASLGGGIGVLGGHPRKAMSAGAQRKAGSPVSHVWRRDQDTPKPNWPAIDSIVQSVNKYLLSGYGVPGTG